MDALRDVEIAIAHRPLALEALTEREASEAAAIASTIRRQEWLRGRRALRALVHHRHRSLSYSGTAAVAAGCSTEGVVGVGVDVEERRWMRSTTARFFLTADEIRHASPGDLVRLWTVKEAVFKANAANAGTTLRDYVIDDVSAIEGTARGPAACPVLRYRTTARGRGYLTVAVAVAATNDREESSC